MMRVYVAGIGVLGPGFEGWAKSAPILQGQVPYIAEPLKLDAPEILSGRERRRSGPTIRLALNAAQEAVGQAGIPAPELAAVFGSSAGNSMEIHQILESLATPEMLVSPTLFHNSVHNSAVGYWCISTGCHEPATSIAAHDFTFPATMLKGVAQSVTEVRPVLLTVFDSPFPAPLDRERHFTDSFAVALVLTPRPSPGSKFAMSVSWHHGARDDCTSSPGLPSVYDLFLGNPAGRALPLLEAMAHEKPARVHLRYPRGGHLDIELSPC